MDIGEEVLNQFKEDLKEVGVIESNPNIEGRTMSMMIAPKGKKKK
jgi:translation initiation factor IF-3